MARKKAPTHTPSITTPAAPATVSATVTEDTPTLVLAWRLLTALTRTDLTAVDCLADDSFPLVPPTDDALIPWAKAQGLQAAWSELNKSGLASCLNECAGLLPDTFGELTAMFADAIDSSPQQTSMFNLSAAVQQLVSEGHTEFSVRTLRDTMGCSRTKAFQEVRAAIAAGTMQQTRTLGRTPLYAPVNPMTVTEDGTDA